MSHILAQAKCDQRGNTAGEEDSRFLRISVTRSPAGVLDVGAGRAGDLWEFGGGDDLPARFDLSNDRRLRAAVVVADTGQAGPSWLI